MKNLAFVRSKRAKKKPLNLNDVEEIRWNFWLFFVNILKVGYTHSQKEISDDFFPKSGDLEFDSDQFEKVKLEDLMDLNVFQDRYKALVRLESPSKEAAESLLYFVSGFSRTMLFSRLVERDRLPKTREDMTDLLLFRKHLVKSARSASETRKIEDNRPPIQLLFEQPKKNVPDIKNFFPVVIGG